VTTRPPESEVDLGEPIEREGHETLLPSVTRSVLGVKSYVASEMGVELLPPADDTVKTPRVEVPEERGRGAKTGDIVGGRYIVEGQLGRGGMGRVMRVRHQALGKPFALKLIKSAIATNQKIREMFYREARLASALTHDNICSIVDFGQDETFGLFMVMELLDGQTVHAKLKSAGKLQPKVACDVMWQVADAVRFIHSRQIIHGDIKAENIFLVRTTSQRRLVKLLDFGLARPDLGRTEGVDGTPEYLAPERTNGAPATRRATSTRSASCCSSCSPASCRSPASSTRCSASTARLRSRRPRSIATSSTSAPTSWSRARPRRIRRSDTPTCSRSCTSSARSWACSAWTTPAAVRSRPMPRASAAISTTA
jgi:serine/threonine protein kinase